MGTDQEVTCKGRILIADDDRDLCELLAKALRGCGYAVSMTHTLDRIDDLAACADCVLLDLDFGIGLCGVAALKQIREKKIYTPVVILTGVEPDWSVVRKLKELRIIALCEKAGTFLETLERVLASLKDGMEVKRAFDSIAESSTKLAVIVDDLLAKRGDLERRTHYLDRRLKFA